MNIHQPSSAVVLFILSLDKRYRCRFGVTVQVFDCIIQNVDNIHCWSVQLWRGFLVGKVRSGCRHVTA